ncbi:MAG: cupin domain-containing protein [Pseudomonadota bacterium]
MRVNADFDQRVVVKYEENEWVPSPMAGVERKMLDRIGDEIARATTIVRYAPGSSFSAHTHDGGEEYIVLEGVFQDEHGDFPVGSYVRNPPTSSHTPASGQGAIIFVKLHQFDPQDRTQVHEKIQSAIDVQPLFSDDREAVRVEHWKPNSKTEIDTPGGLELLVLEGSISESGDQLEKWDWLRLPPGARMSAEAGANGAKVWIKSGHLKNLSDS